VVVSWEGKIYDATITPPVYGIDEKKILRSTQKIWIHWFTGQSTLFR